MDVADSDRSSARSRGAPRPVRADRAEAPLVGLVRRVHRRARAGEHARRGSRRPPRSTSKVPRDEQRLRRHRHRRRLAGRALRRRAGRGRPARRARRARAGRGRVLLLGVHPVEDAAAPRRGGARRARRGGDARRSTSRRALAWRDFMVSNYSDAGQERWLASAGIALLRGSGRLAGPGVVEVDGARHTADHVVVATGSEPIVPPVPGLRELEGIWTQPRGDRR